MARHGSSLMSRTMKGARCPQTWSTVKNCSVKARIRSATAGSCTCSSASRRRAHPRCRGSTGVEVFAVWRSADSGSIRCSACSDIERQRRQVLSHDNGGLSERHGKSELPHHIWLGVCESATQMLADRSSPKSRSLILPAGCDSSKRKQRPCVPPAATPSTVDLIRAYTSSTSAAKGMLTKQFNSVPLPLLIRERCSEVERRR
ncbi:MAG: hypothetical protein JWP65_2767 [Ramlibacter sp.]|jgi:hypothetical protein|nr:hypothetical protein [Ramlibacter sp.]